MTTLAKAHKLSVGPQVFDMSAPRVEIRPRTEPVEVNGAPPTLVLVPYYVGETVYLRAVAYAQEHNLPLYVW